jgi:hypothetical protein
VRREIEPLRDRVRPPRNEQAKGSSRRLPCLSGDRRQGSGGTTHDLDALADDLGAAAAGHGALQTVARSRPEDGSVTHHLKPACHPSIGVGQRDLVSHVRTLCTSSSRADTARTRRRYIRPALAAASLRERAGRLARDTELWLCCDGVREREARIVRSRPPQGQARCASRSVRPLRASIVEQRSSPWHAGTSGGAGRIGSKRLDPGAPTTPRPAIAGRPGACRK